MPFRRALRAFRSHRTPLAAMTPILVPALLLGSAARASITGVCPDGSIFIVQRASAIPCKDHKEVEPGNVPPIKPEYLPRPYAWQVFNQQQNPNNPYNLVDEAQKVRDASQARAAEPSLSSPPLSTPPVSAPPPRTAPVGPEPPRTALVTREPTPPEPQPELGLSDDEIHDLLLIVHLAQRRAPATFEADEERAVTVRLARSTSFEPRLRNARRGLPSGPVLLFAAVAEGSGAFHANLAFVQGHEAFQPDRANPDQLGLIRGRLGQMQADEAVLGYVVLPERMSPEKPIDIYWNDRRLTATLQP